MALMATDYEWRPIQDLPADWVALTDSELPAIRQVYADLKALDPDATARWELQSRREWAIETGRVEGVYHWDRGTTETLMARGIIPDLIPRKGNVLEPEQIAAIIGDALEVLGGLFDFVKGDRPLSKSYIHELHQALLKNVHTYPVRNDEGVVTEQRLEKGVYKRYPNSVKTPEGARHAYCPPEHVEAEMDRLVEWHRRHVLDDVAPEVEAAWLHHRFTQIHPYPDGNGRVARALATLVLIQGGLFPLTVQGEEREGYWRALLDADHGSLDAFVRTIRFHQGTELATLSQLAHLPGAGEDRVDSVSAAIEALKLDLMKRGQIQPIGWTQTNSRMEVLREQCFLKLRQLSGELKSALRPDLALSVRSPRDEEYKLAASLFFSPDDRPCLTFGFAIAGEKNRGIGECVAHWQDKSNVRVGRDRFLITYAESMDAQQRRFDRWMEAALVDGLQRWRVWLRA